MPPKAPDQEQERGWGAGEGDGVSLPAICVGLILIRSAGMRCSRVSLTQMASETIISRIATAAGAGRRT